MKQRKTWQEKLDDDKGLPKVSLVTGTLTKRWGTGTMVIPAPREVASFVANFEQALWNPRP